MTNKKTGKIRLPLPKQTERKFRDRSKYDRDDWRKQRVDLHNQITEDMKRKSKSEEEINDFLRMIDDE